mmetsp:Transcript_20833/g.19884  ORF Transcript_20833/g.19884 Transcript_20833/m.19884 type:complete len:87 (-) Transcript_20833:428-688(-)
MEEIDDNFDRDYHSMMSSSNGMRNNGEGELTDRFQNTQNLGSSQKKILEMDIFHQVPKKLTIKENEEREAVIIKPKKKVEEKKMPL